MANLWILLPAILISVFSPLPQSASLISSIDYQMSPSCSDQQNQNSLSCELEEAKLRVTRLESIFEERCRDVNGQNQYLRDCEEKIEKLTVEIDRLKTELSSYRDDYLRANEKLSALEEKVRLRWAASKKINFEIYGLEQKALEAERKLEEVTSKLERRVILYLSSGFKSSNLSRLFTWQSSSGDGSLLFFCKSKAFQLFSATQHYHHQLQGFIMHAMESNELTKDIAHEEVIFFV